jgi:hypothetical protein
MVNVSGLNPKHFDALELVQKKQWSDIDGRLMRVLTRRGFAVVKKIVAKRVNGAEVNAATEWTLTPAGRKAIQVRG